MVQNRWMDNSPTSTAENQLPRDTGASKRLLSLDTFRGLIMCTLAINGFALAKTAASLGYGPDVEVDSTAGQIWQFLSFHNRHPEWNSQFYGVGCSYWDLIQPAFMFMVGVAMPYSYASRRRRGDSQSKLVAHALVRSIVLVLLGVFLATRYSGLPSNRLLTNVLAQIGLGYFFVFLLLGRSAKLQIGVAVAILVGYWGWLVQYPVSETLPQKSLESIEPLSVPQSIAKHFAIHTNAAAQADTILLNFWHRQEPVQVHAAGYATLNFVPSMVTMLLGVLAGTLLRSDRSDGEKVRNLLIGGLLCMTLAIIASYTVCPIVKKIWTPAWTLYSGAWVLWILAALYFVIDVKGWKFWTFPLVVVGTNSLAIYLMSQSFKPWIAGRWEVYLGDEIFSGSYGPTVEAVCIFAVLWLACLYLYRSKIFFRV